MSGVFTDQREESGGVEEAKDKVRDEAEAEEEAKASLDVIRIRNGRDIELLVQ